MTHVSTFPRSLSHGRKADVAYSSSSLRRDRRQDGGRGSANNIDNMDGPPAGLTTGRSGELIEHADVGFGTLRRRSLERSKQSIEQQDLQQDRFKDTRDRSRDPKERPGDHHHRSRASQDASRSWTLERGGSGYKPTCEELEERRARPLYSGPRGGSQRRANGYSESSNDTDDAVWSNWEEPFRKFDLDLTRPLPSNGAWPASLWEAHTPRRESSVSSSLTGGGHQGSSLAGGGYQGSLRSDRGAGGDARISRDSGISRDSRISRDLEISRDSGVRSDFRQQQREDASQRSESWLIGDPTLRDTATDLQENDARDTVRGTKTFPNEDASHGTKSTRHASRAEPLERPGEKEGHHSRDGGAGHVSSHRGYASDSDDSLTWLEQQRNRLNANRVTQRYPRTDQQRLLVAELRESQKNLAAGGKEGGAWAGGLDKNNNEPYDVMMTGGGKQRVVERYGTLDGRSRGGGAAKYSTLDNRGHHDVSDRYNTFDSRTHSGAARLSAFDSDDGAANKYSTLDSRGTTKVEYSTLDRRGRQADKGTSVGRSFSFRTSGEGGQSRFQSLPRNSRFEDDGRAGAARGGGGRYVVEEEVSRITSRPVENGVHGTRGFDSLNTRHQRPRKAHSTAALNDDSVGGFYKTYNLRSTRSRDFKQAPDDVEITLQPIGVKHLEDFDHQGQVNLERVEHVRRLERSATLRRIPKSSTESFRRGMAQLKTNSSSGQTGLERERSFTIKPKSYMAKPGSYTAQPEPFVEQNGSSHHVSGSSTLPIGFSSKRSGSGTLDQSWQSAQPRFHTENFSLSDTSRNSAFRNNRIRSDFSERTAETSQYQNDESLPRSSRPTNVPVQFVPDNGQASSIARQYHSSEIHRPIAISPTADPKYSNPNRGGIPSARPAGATTNNNGATEVDGFVVEQAIPRSGGAIQRGPDTPDGAIRQYLAKEEAMMMQEMASRHHGTANPDMMHYEADEARVRAVNENASRGWSTLPNQQEFRYEQRIQTNDYRQQGAPNQQGQLREPGFQGIQRGGETQQLGEMQRFANNQNGAFQSQQIFNQAQQNLNQAQQNLSQQQPRYASQQNVAQVMQQPNQYPAQQQNQHPVQQNIQQTQYHQIQQNASQHQYQPLQNMQQNMQQNAQQNTYAVQQNALQHQQQHQYPVQQNASHTQQAQYQAQQITSNAQTSHHPTQQITSQTQQTRYQVQQNAQQIQPQNQDAAQQNIAFQSQQGNYVPMRSHPVQPQQPQFARSQASNQHNSQRRNSIDDLEPFLREFTDTSPATVNRPEVVQQRQTFTAGFQQQGGQSGQSNTLPGNFGQSARGTQFQAANASGGFNSGGAQPVRVVNVQQAQSAVSAQSGSLQQLQQQKFQQQQQQHMTGNGHVRQQSAQIAVNASKDGGFDYQEPVAYKQASNVVPAAAAQTSIRTNVFTQTQADLPSDNAHQWGLNHQTNGPFKSQQLSGFSGAAQEVPELPIYAEVPKSNSNAQTQQLGSQSSNAVQLQQLGNQSNSAVQLQQLGSQSNSAMQGSQSNSVIQPQREQTLRTIASVGDGVPTDHMCTMQRVTPCGFDMHGSDGGFQPNTQSLQAQNQDRYIPDGQNVIMDNRNASLKYGDMVMERSQPTAFKTPTMQNQQGLLGIAPERYYIQQQQQQAVKLNQSGLNSSQWSSAGSGYEGQGGVVGGRELSFSSSVNQTTVGGGDMRGGTQQGGYQTFELSPSKPQSLSSMDSNQSPRSLELEARFRNVGPFRSSLTDPSSPSVSADRSSGGSLGSSRGETEHLYLSGLDAAAAQRCTTFE